MNEGGRTTVTVEIAGEQYVIRTAATPEHARECARLVDQAISEVLEQGGLVEIQKGAILAALALADQLLETRTAIQQERDANRRLASKLAADMEAGLSPDGLASGS
jgi:cell division protein ZapA